ncbi:MAG TPA: PDR/VanB family oxidoreductase, partial [Sphingomonadaceae bacterium]|nr:PDR/VanB family oxidoreductase [Sphingomonadaceae bacterium]
IRPYSLAFCAGDGAAYRVGVKLERDGGGGSRYLFDTARVGDRFAIGGPRNHFPLDEAAPYSVLIAGGIGVTPIRCMAEHLTVRGQHFSLHYAVASRGSTAFLPDLRRFAPELDLHVDAEQGGVLDIAAIVAAAPEGAHYYCCGPVPMLAAFEAATAHLPAGQAHLEYFKAPETAPAAGGFTVVLARSGRTLFVPEGATILQTLRDAGLTATASCEQGICGTCETGVLEGTPDHRDLLLTPAEKASGKTMMICCSGSRTDKLVLDL